MKKIFLSVPAFLCCFFAAAQSSTPDVLASGGGFASGPGFTNSFTIGQGSIPETYSTATFFLTQAFQQPSGIGTGFAPVMLPSKNIGTFPNPSNGQFFLEYTLEENAVVTVEVFDVLGQRIYTETTSKNTGKQMHEVNLATQANGIYFVNCIIKTSAGTTTNTTKITITRQ